MTEIENFAYKLKERFMKVNTHPDKLGEFGKSMPSHSAAECAIIVVDTMLETDLKHNILGFQIKRHHVRGVEPDRSQIEFWQRVRDELSKDVTWPSPAPLNPVKIEIKKT